MAAYLFATISCGIAWAKSTSSTKRRLAAFLTVLEAMLFSDMVINGRWLLHNWVETKAIAENLYAQRFGPQLAALAILCVAAAVGTGLILFTLHDNAAVSVAVCGAILSIGCWCAEVVSLHAVDAVFHKTISGIMAVSLIWVASSLMTGLGILLDLRAGQDATR
jgi:hypothetical protein